LKRAADGVEIQGPDLTGGKDYPYGALLTQCDEVVVVLLGGCQIGLFRMVLTSILG
jgi:hypothetical protein